MTVLPGSPGAGRPVSLTHAAVSICTPSPAGVSAGLSPGLGLTGPRGPRSSQLRPGRGLTQGMSVRWGTGELSERASAGQAGPSDPHLFPSYRTAFSDGPCTKSALREN